MSMKGSKSSLLLLSSLALFLAFYHETTQAQDLPFSLDGSGNDCYVQCPMECPQLNLDMVDCVVYCKMKCTCPADDTECATKAMDKMQKSADERESVIGPDEEDDQEVAETPEYLAVDISQAGASDSDAAFAPESAALSPESEELAAGDLAFAADDGGETGLSPADALAPETETTTFVIEMDASPSPNDGAPTPSEEARAPQGSDVATPLSAPAASTPQSAAAVAPTSTPTSSIAPSPQDASAPTPQKAAASPAPQNSAAAPGPNAPSPA